MQEMEKRPKRRSASQASEEIRRWVLEDQTDKSSDESDVEFRSDDSQADSDNVHELNDNEESEYSCETDDDLQTENVTTEEETASGENVYVSKDQQIKWYSTPRTAPQGRRSQANIVRSERAIRIGNKQLEKPSDALSLYLDDNFFDLLLQHTNAEMKRRREHTLSNQIHCLQDFDVRELKAAVGIAMFVGATCASRESLEQMWSDVYGRPILRAAMSLKRFKVFVAAARFDDKATRTERIQTDRLAPIREMFDEFVDKCKRFYNPSPFVCVDESLLAFRGRCRFKVYIPSKPAKYGIKVWSLCDTGTQYACNLQVYLGKLGDAPEQQQGARVVKDLSMHLYNSGRNITTDNFFTSHSLAQFLLTKKLTLLGTMRKSRTELPTALMPKRRPEFESIFAFTADTTLVSYAPKKNKSVILLSTMHNTPEVFEDVPGSKPYMILDYNSTKGAVDAFDQQISIYSSHHKTRRWPMRLFYFILDAAALNSFVIWNMYNQTWRDHAGSRRLDKRRLYITEAAHDLMQPHISARAANANIAHMPSVGRALMAIGLQPCARSDSAASGQKRGRCQSCDRKKDQKVEHKCVKCGEFVCGKHGSKTVTYSCIRCPLKPDEDMP